MIRHDRKHFGFTLIELLVVISIIALLIGILLPALSASRKTAQAVVCSSNIRQLTIANISYTNDNKDFFVLAAKDIWHPNLERWHGKRTSMTEAFEPEKSDLAQYFGESGDVKECPSFLEGDDYQDGFEDGCGGYGYNSSYIGGRNDIYGASLVAAQNSARTADVRKPTQTVMFTDTAYIIDTDNNKAAYSFCEPPFWQLNAGPPSSMRPNPTIDFRHQGTCNAAWVDGHVDRQNLEFSYNYQTHSVVTDEEAMKLGVGWFGPQSNELFDLN